MNTLRRSHLFGIVVCLLLSALVIAPASAGAVWDSWVSTRTIAENSSPPPFKQYVWRFPQISGNYVVWQRRPWEAVTGSACQLYDIRTGTTKTIGTSSWEAGAPTISGDWVAVSEGDSSEIFAYRISTKVLKQVTNRAGSQDWPDLSGSRLVFFDFADSSVRLYDLSTSREKVIETGCDAMAPKISGTRVVYLKGGQVRVEDVNSGTVTVVASEPGAKTSMAINGYSVAWARHNGLNYDVWMRDLGSAASVLVAGGAGNQTSPAISGSKVLYLSDSSGFRQVHAYDTIMESSKQLTNNAIHHNNPEITGVNVVWATVPGADLGNIVLGHLSAPTLSISAPSTIGYNATFKVNGSLTEAGFPVAYRDVSLQRSSDGGKTWSFVATAKTNSSGAYSITTPSGLKKAAIFRTRYGGRVQEYGGSYRLAQFSALSSSKTVKPKVYLGTPTATSYTKAEDRYFTVRGSLKPRHTSGTKPVQIKVYKKVDGKYVWKKTYTASVYDYDTYSKYKASIRLTSPGRWRIRAYYPTSSTNYKTYSSYRYFTAY